MGKRLGERVAEPQTLTLKLKLALDPVEEPLHLRFAVGQPIQAFGLTGQPGIADLRLDDAALSVFDQLAERDAKRLHSDRSEIRHLRRRNAKHRAVVAWRIERFQAEIRPWHRRSWNPSRSPHQWAACVNLFASSVASRPQWHFSAHGRAATFRQVVRWRAH